MRLLHVCGTMVGIALLVATANAAEVLDQQNGGAVGFGLSPTDVQEVAQTFTVGVDGTLSRVEFYIARTTALAVEDLTITIYNTEAGIPTTSLGSANITGNYGTGMAEFRSVDFSSLGIPLSAGEMLAFGVKKVVPDSGIHIMPYGTVPQYADGGAFYRFYTTATPTWVSSTGFDYGFKTYVLTEDSEELLGDYNDDGTIDAADYTVWRNTLESGGMLLHDATPESVAAEDYDYWKAHYGESSAGAGGIVVPVPETASIVLLSMTAAVVLGRFRRSE